MGNISAIIAATLLVTGVSLPAAEENPVFKSVKYGSILHYAWGGTAFARTKHPDMSVPNSIFPSAAMDKWRGPGHAVALRSGREIRMAQNEQGVRFDLTHRDGWNPLDTVIKVTVTAGGKSP